MNISKKNEELKRLEININSKIEIKEESIENYEEGFCDEEKLNSASLKSQEQGDEIGLNVSNWVDPNLTVKFEVNCKMKMEYAIEEYERKTEDVTEDKYNVKNLYDCEVKMEDVVEEDFDSKNEDALEEGNEIKMKDVPQKKMRICLLSLNPEENVQFCQLEASEFPKVIIRKVNVEEQKTILASSRLENVENLISKTRDGNNLKSISELNSIGHKNKVTQSKEMMFRCSECDYKTDKKTVLKTHKLIHSNSEIKLFKCGVCDYGTNYKQKLKFHLLKHSNECKLFKCSECSFETNYSSSLKTHFLIHSANKLFKCSECEYEGNYETHLRLHILNRHSNQKEFQCSECSFATNYKHNLKSHFFVHSKVKRFKCSECDYETNCKKDLKSHLLNHANLKLFKCSECDYESKWKNGFNRHMLQHSNAQNVPSRRTKKVL